LSFSARGKIADAIVYSGWKGLETVRKYVTPANPQTADQIAQRAILTAIVSAWKNYFILAACRANWNRSALNDSRALSGFNYFASQAMQVAAADPDASFASLSEPIANQLVSFTCLNLDDGAQADEAGNFEIWVGSTISGMTHSEDVALAGGDVIGTVDLGDAGDMVYAQIRKGGYDRSGISHLELQA